MTGLSLHTIELIAWAAPVLPVWRRTWGRRLIAFAKANDSRKISGVRPVWHTDPVTEESYVVGVEGTDLFDYTFAGLQGLILASWWPVLAAAKVIRFTFAKASKHGQFVIVPSENPQTETLSRLPRRQRKQIKREVRLALAEAKTAELEREAGL